MGNDHLRWENDRQNDWGNNHLPKLFSWKMTGNGHLIMGNCHLPKAFSWENDWKMTGNNHFTKSIFRSPENAFGSGKMTGNCHLIYGK